MKKIKVDKDKLLEAIVKRAEGFYYTEEIFEYSKKETKKKIEECDPEEENLPSEKLVSKKNGSKRSKLKNMDIYSVCNKSGDEENIESWSGETHENEQGLELLKKKITTHYVPPDMSAIKIIIENFGKEINSGNMLVDEMSDEELLKMRRDLIEKLDEF